MYPTAAAAVHQARERAHLPIAAHGRRFAIRPRGVEQPPPLPPRRAQPFAALVDHIPDRIRAPHHAARGGDTALVHDDRGRVESVPGGQLQHEAHDRQSLGDRLQQPRHAPGRPGDTPDVQPLAALLLVARPDLARELLRVVLAEPRVDGEHQPTIGGGEVDPLVQRDEAATAVFQFALCQQGGQRRAGEAVEVDHQHGVDPPLLGVAQQRGELGARVRVVVEGAFPGLPVDDRLRQAAILAVVAQQPLLRVQGIVIDLIGGRDADIAPYSHAAFSSSRARSRASASMPSRCCFRSAMPKPKAISVHAGVSPGGRHRTGGSPSAAMT